MKQLVPIIDCGGVFFECVAPNNARKRQRYVSQRGSVHVEGLERGEGSLR
jgi:hypothetical protein